MKNTAFANMSTAELHQEYVSLALGSMIYDADTKTERRKIADEIDRREGREPFDWDKAGNAEYINNYIERNGRL